MAGSAVPLSALDFRVLRGVTQAQLAYGTCQALADVPIRRGGRVYLQNVRLTESQPFGPVNMGSR